jgi:hypothetical protein
MRHSSALRSLLLVTAVALLAAACAEPTITRPDAAPQFSASGPRLLECPTSETSSVSGIIDLLGGTLAVGPHYIVLPPGAVLEPTEFTITEPASRFVEIRVRANGLDGFAFLEPISISISYERCTRNLADADLTIYKIDPQTKQLLRHMGGSNDPVARRVTVASDSLSGYSIAQ